MCQALYKVFYIYITFFILVNLGLLSPFFADKRSEVEGEIRIQTQVYMTPNLDYYITLPP